jgi:hypothetical protein
MVVGELEVRGQRSEEKRKRGREVGRRKRKRF